MKDIHQLIKHIKNMYMLYKLNIFDIRLTNNTSVFMKIKNAKLLYHYFIQHNKLQINDSLHRMYSIKIYINDKIYLSIRYNAYLVDPNNNNNIISAILKRPSEQIIKNIKDKQLFIANVECNTTLNIQLYPDSAFKHEGDSKDMLSCSIACFYLKELLDRSFMDNNNVWATQTQRQLLNHLKNQKR